MTKNAPAWAAGWIDAHCHLADPRLDETRAAVLARAAAAGITGFVQGGVDPEDWARQRRLAGPGWLLSFGLHPWFVAEADAARCDQGLHELEQQIGEAAALGELGLDFAPRFARDGFAQQHRVFGAQLQMAQRHRKPLVLHIVRAHGPALEQLARHGPRWRGIVHAFSGSREIAREYGRLGLLVSIGPAVLRPGFKKVKAALSHIPLDGLVVESDAPDGPPHLPDRATNEPDVLMRVAEVVAAAHDCDAATVLQASRTNLLRVFSGD
ncbi:TatD family hydrolase [Acanthopleuribacter pedis]|uniref:TatD family hydrolase n=1 Tax=Acanthopleuribacter pedis TaxID=442870 RepID=A0A8J7QPS6_9BACT|nr:TatD family hydrolase [Acanthopleuribacter pedis]